MEPTDPVQRALLALADERRQRLGPAASCCPSEVARRLDPRRWRERMDEVHRAVDALLAARRVRLHWQGVDLPTRRGAYRIRLVVDD